MPPSPPGCPHLTGPALLIIAVSISGGCGKAEIRDPTGGAPVEGVLLADCAPWDGAATSLFFAPEGLQHLPPPPPYLQIVVYASGSGLAAARFVLGENRAGSGIAVRCASTRECATADSGTVEFRLGPDDSTLSGAYRIYFPDHLISSAFRARWVLREAMCG